MNPSIYDVAKQAGVSIATVSRVLNKKGIVKIETEKKVIAAMEKLEYQPNMNATGLAQNTTRIIGALLPEFSDYSIPDSFTLEFLNGIQQVLSEQGYSLLIINDSFNKKIRKTPDYIKIIQGKRIDGLIAVSKKINDKYFSEIAKSGFPIVVFGEKPEELPLQSLNLDFHEHSRKALHYLFEKNHREIAIIYFENEQREIELKLNTFRRIYEELGLKFDTEQNTINGAFDKVHLYERIIKCLSNGSNTAFFVDSVFYAHQLIDAAHELNLRIPEDISIVCLEYVKNEGFWLHPPVTGIYVDSFEMGRECAKSLFKMIIPNGVENETCIMPLLNERNSVEERS